jgi:hypothetical protein
MVDNAVWRLADISDFTKMLLVAFVLHIRATGRFTCEAIGASAQSDGRCPSWTHRLECSRPPLQTEVAYSQRAATWLQPIRS